jgi:hypothetical protein
LPAILRVKMFGFAVAFQNKNQYIYSVMPLLLIKCNNTVVLIENEFVKLKFLCNATYIGNN